MKTFCRQETTKLIKFAIGTQERHIVRASLWGTRAPPEQIAVDMSEQRLPLRIKDLKERVIIERTKSVQLIIPVINEPRHVI
jgi:hypothetical protein